MTAELPNPLPRPEAEEKTLSAAWAQPSSP